MPEPRKPTVALLIETSRAHGRESCLGVAEYARMHGAWNFVLEERDLRGGVPEWLRTWDGDGILCRIFDPQLASVLASASLPVLDTYGQSRHPDIPFFGADADAVAMMAARFFVDAAFTSFAFCGYPGLWFSDDRSLAFQKAMERSGAKVDVYRPPLSWNSTDVAGREGLHPSGSPELEKWVSGRDHPGHRRSRTAHEALHQARASPPPLARPAWRHPARSTSARNPKSQPCGGDLLRKATQSQRS